MNKYILSKSTRQNKKYMVKTPNNKTIHFGSSIHSDYTKHKNLERKNRYDARHSKNENWTKSGIETAGFWAKWLLWTNTSIDKAIKHIETRFKIKIINNIK